MRLCDLALDQEPLSRKDRAATYVNRGILLMRQGNFERAMWDYQEGLRLQPTLLEAKVNIGAALYGMQRYDEAMQALNEGIKTDSPEARAVGLYNRGLIWEHKGNVAGSLLRLQGGPRPPTRLSSRPPSSLSALRSQRSLARAAEGTLPLLLSNHRFTAYLGR